MIVNRSSFAPVSPTEAYVLGSDGNLWLEQFGSGQTTRVQVDGDVQAFQPLGCAQALVLGLDSNLWLEQGPWGTVPPMRQQVDANVKAFQALSLGTITQIYVLGQDGNLWLEQAPFGQQVPLMRQQVADQVADFFGVSATEVYVLGSDGNLWLSRASSAACRRSGSKSTATCKTSSYSRISAARYSSSGRTATCGSSGHRPRRCLLHGSRSTTTCWLSCVPRSVSHVPASRRPFPWSHLRAQSDPVSG